MSQYSEEIERRRTFAIISHPDAGKTTLTEKLLLFGGAIHVAGAVKSNKIKKTATSDWMEIEKQRGISVATSVMAFDYSGHKINILDTPGHQDFAEDTFRTLTAVDSVIIVIDTAKGVEAQTRKLMEVCRMRKTPVIVFVNKMDRDGKDPFDLLDEIEEELHIHVRPLSWPIDMGQRFRGVYNIYKQKLNLYTPSKQYVTENVEFKDINSPELENYIEAGQAEKLRSDIELIEGVYPEFDVDTYLKGDIAPVFFGSALNNFGVKELLDCFINIAPSLPSRVGRGTGGRSGRGCLLRFRFQDPCQYGPESSQLYCFREDLVPAVSNVMPTTSMSVSEDDAFQQSYGFHGAEEGSGGRGFCRRYHRFRPDTGNFKIGDTLTSGEEASFQRIAEFLS